MPLPITLGHEIGGVVEQVGSEVSNLKPGMRVCVPFNFADGTCPYCRRGKQNLCENALWNFTTPGSGGFAEFARVPNARLNCIPLPENVTERDGAALGCRYKDDTGQVTIPIDQLVLSEWSVTGTLGNPHGDYGDLLSLVNNGRL